MHPGDCPEWEYSTYARSGEILTQGAVQTLIQLRQGLLDTFQLSADTRPVHHRLFIPLVPSGYEYYAGHYRGEPFRCLRYYEVQVPSDPRVGYPPDVVPLLMNDIKTEVERSFRTLDQANQLSNAEVSAEQKLLYLVAIACRLFELFLRIHPYANGNGHIARFLVWSVLGRYGYWPKKWPLHPRPPDPPYSELIRRYRDGDLEPLEQYVLSNIVG